MSEGIKKRTRYISGIDGIRAMAVLMVLAYHLKMPFAKGGLLGVTTFFVISGFLITRILLTELNETNTINLKKFWVRRIRRLFPAILAMIAPLILVSALVNRVLFTKACADVLSVVFCYNNWWQIFNKVSYFENAGAPSPLTHCWSLAIEMQFYLVYPLLLMLLFKARHKKRVMAGVTMALAVLSIGLMWILFDPAKDPSRVYYGTDTRVFSLLLGAFLAMGTRGMNVTRKFSSRFCDLVGTASLFCLLFLMVRVDGYSSFLYHGGQALASLFTVAVIFCVLHRESILGRVLSVPLLKWTGECSYGIYLWHYPLILLISGGKQAAWWMVVLELLLTFVLAGLSYHFVETPVRHGVIRRNITILRSRPQTSREKKRKIQVQNRSRKVVISAMIIGLCVVLCIAFVPKKSAVGNVEELEKQAKEAEELANKKAAKNSDGGTKETAETAPQTDEEILQNLNLLLIGDSIALGAADEFNAQFPNSICDAAVSRYTTESFAIYDNYVNANGWDGDGVIFALGSNGALYDSLPTLRDMIGDKPLFVFTARAPYTSWEQSNNAEIYQFVEETDNTYLIDWYKASDGHSEYFVDDETHLTDAGAKAYVNCIKEAVLKVYKKE